jgi:hypothetical protein
LRTYSNIISLTKNSRGVYSIDPSLGCKSGLEENVNGCFNDCYANRIAKIYGYDFSQTVYRDFKSKSHLNQIRNQIKKVKLPFIRMGTMGDPSENWDHTLRICELIQFENQLYIFQEKPKEIVIITKHWKQLTTEQLERLKKLNVCINTSISALDSLDKINFLLSEFEKLKSYCRSVLRVVTFDFNKENEDGLRLSLIQDEIIKNRVFIDTVFRASKKNKLVTEGVINIHKTKFLGKNALVSKMNKKTYFGNCKNCLEMCGVKM